MIDHYTIRVDVNQVSHVWTLETITREDVLELAELPHARGVISYILTTFSGRKCIGMLTRGESIDLRKSEAYFVDFMATAEEVSYCSGCGCLIDETTCHCGDAITHHSGWTNHGPVPMGCVCGYESYEPFVIVEPVHMTHTAILSQPMDIEYTSDAVMIAAGSKDYA